MKSILHCFRFVILVVLFTSKVLDVQALTVTANASGNWSGSAWGMTARSGTISTSTTSATVTGSGTNFTAQVNVGNIIRTPAGVAIGTVLSVNSLTSITLTMNATSTNTSIVCNVSGVIPTDAVVIAGGFTVTMDVASSTCATLALGANGSGSGTGTLLFNSGTQLIVNGTVTIGGSVTPNKGFITMTNGGTLTSKGFTITNAGTWTPGSGTIELNGTNIIPTAFFAGVFNNLTISVTTTTASNSLVIGGNLNIPNGSASVFSTAFALAVTGTTNIGVIGGGTSVLIFTSASGTKTMNGLVTIGNGGTWNNSSGNSPVTFHGGIANSGVFSAGSGIQTFNTGNQTIIGSLTIPSVTVTGINLTNNNSLIISTALAGTGTLTQGGNSTLNIDFTGPPGIAGITATATGNNVYYDAGGIQTIFATDYYNLYLTNSGVKTLQTGTSNISGNFNINGTASSTGVASLNVGGDLITTANASFNTGAFIDNITGSLNNAGSFTGPTGSTVNVGTDVNNNGTFNAGAASVANITGNVNNAGTFNGGVASFLNIAGNASNTGTLNAGTNTIVFNGSALQTLSNTGGGAANNITINNTSDGLQLLTNLTVPNTLDMTMGNIDLNGNNLFIGTFTCTKGTLLHTSGTIVGTGSVERWFDNSVIADGDQAGLYPVGTVTDYHPFSVSTPTGPAGGGSITLTYTDASTSTAVSIPDGTSTINTLDDLNWNLAVGDGLNGGSYNLRVEGTGYGTVTDVNDLRISLAGSVVGVAGINAGTTTDPQVNRTGLADADLNNTFFFGFSSGNPLPITLVYFKAYPVNNEVKLDWETSAEVNNDHFTILRSNNSSIWETVKQVPGSGNTSTNSLYTAYDQNPLEGVSYYKLQQTDIDGKFTYSKIVSVNMGQTTSMAIYPNPATSLLFITTPDSGKIEFQVFNSAGQMIFIPSDNSPNSIRLNISSLPAGAYQLQTLHQGVKQTQTIIKN